jgi:3-oxo-5-alpha-steroid 4-dehydrogenase 3
MGVWLLDLLADWLAPLYVALSLIAVASRGSAFLRTLASHGKTLQPKLMTQWLDYFWVSKRYFVHFYITGLVSLVAVFISCQGISDTKLLIISVPATMLLGFHLLRRTYECLHVHQFRKSKMHVAGYLLGMGHYLVLPMVFVETNDSIAIQSTPRSMRMNVSTSALIVFHLWAQYEQYRHHDLLADLRRPAYYKHDKGNKNDTKDENNKSSLLYRLPRKGWFQWVICPHYLAEILIYLSFALLLHHQSNLNTLELDYSVDENITSLEAFVSFARHHRHWFLFLWVSTNLTVSALHTHDWYRANHGETLTQRALIPYFF